MLAVGGQAELGPGHQALRLAEGPEGVGVDPRRDHDHRHRPARHPVGLARRVAAGGHDQAGAGEDGGEHGPGPREAGGHGELGPVDDDGVGQAQAGPEQAQGQGRVEDDQVGADGRGLALDPPGHLGRGQEDLGAGSGRRGRAGPRRRRRRRATGW